MPSNIRPVRNLLLLALGATALLLCLPLAAGSAASTRACGSFASQAGAQHYFVEQGGSPERGVGKLDPDRDGVACEGLSGPFAGYATLGYNRKRDFFYGTATMPPGEPGEQGYPCLYGNKHFSDGPRRLNLYLERPGADKAILDSPGASAEAKPDSGRLVWKASKRHFVPGRYYAAFEERVRLHPYGANECPGFRSPTVRIP